MSQVIYLATHQGPLPAPLFCMFDTEIGGESFTFGIHRSLCSGTHLKLSEVRTGKGIAAFPYAEAALTDKQLQSDPGLENAGRTALSALITQNGEHTVAQVLIKNRGAAPVLNEPGHNY